MKTKKKELFIQYTFKFKKIGNPLFESVLYSVVIRFNWEVNFILTQGMG